MEFCEYRIAIVSNFISVISISPLKLLEDQSLAFKSGRQLGTTSKISKNHILESNQIQTYPYSPLLDESQGLITNKGTYA